MPPVNIAKYHLGFESRIDELLTWERSVADMANIFYLKEWMRRRQSESILVLSFSHWERLIENLFCACLARDTSQFGASYGLDLEGRVRLPLAQGLVAGEQYFDFKSFGDIKGRAKRWLVSHPFGKVRKADWQRIDAIQAIRNHVLHLSRKTMRQLKRYVPRRRDVGKHLVTREGGVTRLRRYLLSLKAASASMRP